MTPGPQRNLQFPNQRSRLVRKDLAPNLLPCPALTSRPPPLAAVARTRGPRPSECNLHGSPGPGPGAPGRPRSWSTPGPPAHVPRRPPSLLLSGGAARGAASRGLTAVLSPEPAEPSTIPTRLAPHVTPTAARSPRSFFRLLPLHSPFLLENCAAWVGGCATFRQRQHLTPSR